MLDDAHAEAGQAACRVFGAQVEVVGAAGGTAGTLHVGLQGTGRVTLWFCHSSTDVGTRHGMGTGLTLHWHNLLASHRSPMLPCWSHWHWSPVAPGSGGITRGGGSG